MNRNEYFEIREEIGILNNVSKFLNYVREMTEIYPQFRTMTLENIKDYLDEREVYWEQDIQKKLNVE